MRDTSGSIATEDYIAQPLDFYLREDLYQRLFGIELKYRPRSLDLVLKTRQQLPVFLERQRERARKEQQLMLGAQPEVEYVIPQSRPVLGGGRLDYRFAATTTTRGAPQYRY